MKTFRIFVQAAIVFTALTSGPQLANSHKTSVAGNPTLPPCYPGQVCAIVVTKG